MAWMLTRFGAITLPEAMPQETMNPLPAQSRIVATPAGVFDGDGAGRSDPSYPQTLGYSGVIEPDAGWKATVDALRGAVGTKARLYRTGSDAAIQWCTARLVNMPYERSVENYNWVRVRLEFTQLSIWRGVNHAGWAFDEGELFNSGLLFDPSQYKQTITGSTMNQMVSNGGNVPVTDVIISIAAGPAAYIGFPTLWGPQQQMVWRATITPGSTLLIDCGAHRVTFNGADAYYYFSLGDYHAMGDWCRLQAGNNAMDLVATTSGTLTGSQWTIEFRDGWA